MRPRVALWITGLILPLAVPSAQAGDKDDLRKLQGVWHLVSAMQDGKPLPAEKVQRTTILFKDNTFTFPDLAEQATSQAGTIKIDSSKNPKEMDAISTQGEVMLGIYQLRGSKYQVCFAPTSKARPTEFAAPPGSGNILQFWERKKRTRIPH